MPPYSVFVSLGMVRGLGILKKGPCLWESSLLQLGVPGLTCLRLFCAVTSSCVLPTKTIVIKQHVNWSYGFPAPETLRVQVWSHCCSSRQQFEPFWNVVCAFPGWNICRYKIQIRWIQNLVVIKRCYSLAFLACVNKHLQHQRGGNREVSYREAASGGRKPSSEAATQWGRKRELPMRAQQRHRLLRPRLLGAANHDLCSAKQRAPNAEFPALDIPTFSFLMQLSWGLLRKVFTTACVWEACLLWGFLDNSLHCRDLI